MGKTLVLTEKPSVARDIAKVLGCSQKGNGCLVGAKYIITWALGHLVTLAEPEFYSERYKTWRIEDLPMVPDKMQLIVIKQTSSQFNAVKTLMHRGDIDDLVIATDAGREGELVARWIIQKAGWGKPIKRLWISSQTDRAIREGFANLKPSSQYDNLYKSALSRAEADWLVGLNITRALTCKYNAQLSAGRVQTPTLAMVVEREAEIRKFQPREYWTIEAKVNGFTALWRDKINNQTRIFDKARADVLLLKISGKQAKISQVSTEPKKELPPLAYDLTELQRDANRRYGFSAKQTLNLLQKLYEEYKLVTYPRTDSRYITEDMVSTLAERLKCIAIGPYTVHSQLVLRKGIQVNKRFVDNSKVSDHHAIIPTEQFVNLSVLSSEERNIYDLIVRRFLAVLHPPFEYEQTTITVEVEGETLLARGKVVKAEGWKAVYDYSIELEDIDDENEDGKAQVLPFVKKGEVYAIQSIKTIAAKTKPPSRYNEATLLSAMEHPGKFLRSNELKDAVEQAKGLGTPATRADIIEKLFDSFYLERKGKEILPTSKGMQLVELAPEELRSAELTAKWEMQLSQISKGKVQYQDFIIQMKEYASKLVSNVIASSDIFKHDNLTREKCPECGKYLLEVNGKKGKMLVCQDRECGHRKSVSLVTNARCPECHKKLEMRGQGEDKTFFCSCGYREKLSAFNKRKSEQVSKKDVVTFMKSQNDNEQINSALAEALKKWNK